MAWEQRGGRICYYRAVRTGGSVRKVYFGSGPRAEEASREDELRRRAAEAARVSHRQLQSELLAIEATANAGRDAFRKRAEEKLANAGYHWHRGSWRRRRARRKPAQA